MFRGFKVPRLRVRRELWVACASTVSNTGNCCRKAIHTFFGADHMSRAVIPSPWPVVASSGAARQLLSSGVRWPNTTQPHRAPPAVLMPIVLDIMSRRLRLVLRDALRQACEFVCKLPGSLQLIRQEVRSSPAPDLWLPFGLAMNSNVREGQVPTPVRLRTIQDDFRCDARWQHVSWARAPRARIAACALRCNKCCSEKRYCGVGAHIAFGVD
jgi:hypothetical protein